MNPRIGHALKSIRISRCGSAPEDIRMVRLGPIGPAPDG